MSYQNINQYVFKKIYLTPVREISDISIASDERDFDEEVIFSPLLIGENDGNRLPFKFDFNNSATTVSQTGTTFEYDTIVSENYWNPEGKYNENCITSLELCDVGLTGIDNGLTLNMSGETIEITNGLYTNTLDKFNRFKYDRRFKLHPITGSTTSETRLWNDNSYDYTLQYDTYGDSVGYFAKLQGGFFQGFYKLSGFDYEVFPERVDWGWTTEFLLRYRWIGETNVGLNFRYPENKGTFFYMGARAENKFYHYADGSPTGFTSYTRVTSGLTCMETCACSSSAVTASTCISVYQESGGTSSSCSCSCSCDCPTYAEYPEKDPLYDAVSNALSFRLSGDTGNPKLCVKVYRITGDCEVSGTCVTGLTFNTGTSVTEWCSTKGIFDDCKDTQYINQEHWVQINAVFQRNLFLEDCDLFFKGGLSTIVDEIYTASTANNSISLIKPPLTHDTDSEPAKTNIVNFDKKWFDEGKYRKGTLKFYVNGKLFLKIDDFEEIIPRLLNVEKEKQIGVSYNISIGGGTQGLHDNLTFSGGCADSLTGMTYQQDPECLTTETLSNTIYSGLTTDIVLEELFGGSFIGDISAFRMYTEPLNAAQIRHNFKILKDRYNLLSPQCPNCSADTTCDIVITILPNPTPSPTVSTTPTPTPTSTPI